MKYKKNDKDGFIPMFKISEDTNESEHINSVAIYNK